MSLLKLGKFLKAEGGLKRIWLCFSCQSVPSQRTDAALPVCLQAGLVLCAAQEQHMAWLPPFWPAEHDYFSSAALFPVQTSNCAPNSTLSVGLRVCNTNPGLKQLPTGLKPTASHLLWIWTGGKPRRTEQELGFWVFKRLISLKLEETKGLGLCSLSPWLHGKILSQQDASSVLHSKAEVFCDADVVRQEYISKAQNFVYWFKYLEHCSSLEKGHMKITWPSSALFQSCWRWPIFNQLRH